MLDNLIRYFDLQSVNRKGPEAHSAAARLPVFPQYVALVLGITIQPFLYEYYTLKTWNINITSWIGSLVFGIIIGISIFPAVYKNSFNSSNPKLLQYCSIFTSGIGWQSLVSLNNIIK